MKNNPILKRVKNNNYTLKHVSQAEIDKISQTNFVLFLFWLDNDYKGKQSTDQIKKQMIKNTYDLRGIIQDLIKYNNGHLIKDWNECLKFSNYIDVDIKQFLGIQENKQL